MQSPKGSHDIKLILQINSKQTWKREAHPVNLFCAKFSKLFVNYQLSLPSKTSILQFRAILKEKHFILQTDMPECIPKRKL